MTAAVPAGKITILDRIRPFDPAATTAIRGIQIATVPLLLINADIKQHTALAVTINLRSVFAKNEFPILSPIF